MPKRETSRQHAKQQPVVVQQVAQQPPATEEEQKTAAANAPHSELERARAENREPDQGAMTYTERLKWREENPDKVPPGFREASISEGASAPNPLKPSSAEEK